MAAPESVVFTFPAFRKWRETAFFFYRLQQIAPAGQDFVRVRLVTDIPDQPVVRRVENMVQGDRQLDRAQTGCKMPTHRADRIDQVGAQFVGQRL